VSRLFTLKERQGLAKPQSPQSTASFFFVKKKVVVAFLCVLAPLREPPFHAERTAGSRKAAKPAKHGQFLLCQEEGRCCLSLRLGAFA